MSDRASTALTACIEAQALNDEQERLLFNPTPEIDSLIEYLAGLTAYGVPERVVDRMLSIAADTFKSNRAERGCEREASGLLDTMMRDGRRKALTVKCLARHVRQLLRDLEAGDKHALMARRALAKLQVENPEAFTSPTLAHELGKGRYAQMRRELAQVS